MVKCWLLHVHHRPRRRSGPDILTHEAIGHGITYIATAHVREKCTGFVARKALGSGFAWWWIAPIHVRMQGRGLGGPFVARAHELFSLERDRHLQRMTRWYTGVHRQDDGP